MKLLFRTLLPILFIIKSSILFGQFTDITPDSLPGVYDGDISFGDYDNDGDLDILATGLFAQNQFITYVFKNNEGVFEKAAIQPDSLPGVAEENEGGRLTQGFATEGTPIPDLPVYLLNKAKVLVGLETTDSNGRFQFININSGEYQLAADYNKKPLSLSNFFFEITEDGQSLQLSLLVGDSLSVEIIPNKSIYIRYKKAKKLPLKNNHYEI